jgi:hypothetical protein
MVVALGVACHHHSVDLVALGLVVVTIHMGTCRPPWAVAAEVLVWGRWETRCLLGWALLVHLALGEWAVVHLEEDLSSVLLGWVPMVG